MRVASLFNNSTETGEHLSSVNVIGHCLLLIYERSEEKFDRQLVSSCRLRRPHGQFVRKLRLSATPVANRRPEQFGRILIRTEEGILCRRLLEEPPWESQFARRRGNISDTCAESSSVPRSPPRPVGN
jgi:hypothetical protein